MDFSERSRQFGENVRRRGALLIPFSVETSGLTWMAVHGCICLGLRHPAYTGPSRELVMNFVRTLGAELVQHGVLTESELREVERFETEDSPHGSRGWEAHT